MKMTKKVILLLFILLLGKISMNAQVTIGAEDEPHPGAVLDLRSTKGLKLPTVVLFNVNNFQLSDEEDGGSAVGMMVYNTSNQTTGGQGAGVYIWDGEKWLFASISGGVAVPVTTIMVSSENNETNVTSGLSLQFSASVQPDNATNKTITWSVIPGSGNGSITQSGLFTGGNAGTVTIRATANDGNQAFGVKEITVDAAVIAVADVTVKSEDGTNPTSLNAGSQLQLIAEITPSDATNQTVTWTVSSGGDTGTTVNSNGLVTGSGAGNDNGNSSVTIRATSTSDNSKYGEYNLTIIGSTGPGEVTGSNGTYSTWCFNGTPGNICWMTQNSKEGTSSATTYSGKKAGERGYYYTWAQAANSSNTAACPSGWTLPAQADWEALKSYLNGTPDATFKTAWYASALAGDYTSSRGWGSWESFGTWWSKTSSNQYFNLHNSTMGGPYAGGGYWYSVRCVKSN
jgi:uncharacterized protein (TIGR02145 family)